MRSAFFPSATSEGQADGLGGRAGQLDAAYGGGGAVGGGAAARAAALPPGALYAERPMSRGGATTVGKAFGAYDHTAYAGPAAAADARGSSSLSAGSGGGGGGPRGLRFPTSRRYLWDRTPAGPQVLVSAPDLLPRLSISAAALAALARAVATGGAVATAVPLRLSLATTRAYQLTGLLQEQGDADASAADAAAGADCSVSVACRIIGSSAPQQPRDAEALEAAGGGDDALASALAARIDAHGATQVSQVGREGWVQQVVWGPKCTARGF